MNDDGAVVGVENSEFNELSGSRWSDDHHEAIVEVLIADGVVERMEDVFVGDAVLACAVDDQRRLHDLQYTLP